jgi:hypothetical protein
VNLIHNPMRLHEVIDEISEWPLDRRRQYIASIGQAFGEAEAQQIRDGLKALWEKRKR